MKEYLVSVDVMSDQLSVQEISVLLGIEAGPDSRNKASIDGLGRLCTSTLWRVDSELPETAPLDEHFSVLSRRFGFTESCNNWLPEGAQAFINIGVFYDTAYCSLEIDPDWLQTFAASRLGLNISCYPCDNNEDG